MANVRYTAEKLNFRIHRGDAFIHTFGLNWDISAATVSAKIVDENNELIVNLSVSAITFADGESTFTISLTKEQTDHLGAYNWFMVVDETGEKTFLNGEFVFIERPYEN